MKRRSLKHHPAAGTFPELAEPDLARLALDLKKDGLVNPIVLCDGMVLDGRARLVACERAHVEPRFFTYEGDDPVDFVTQANGGRQMSPGQRAIAAARAARAWKVSGVSPDTSEVSGDTSADASLRAARRFGLSRSTVCRAEKLVEEATPETVAAVEGGRLRVHEALKSLAAAARKPARGDEASLARAVVTRATRAKKKCQVLREELRELCAEKLARSILDDVLLDLSKDLYAFADGSAYAADGGSP